MVYNLPNFYHGVISSNLANCFELAIYQSVLLLFWFFQQLLVNGTLKAQINYVYNSKDII